MFCGVLGAALLAGSRTLWVVLAIWWPFALAVIRLEEREMENRFGNSYKAYRKQVPAYLPLHLFAAGPKSKSRE
jgi:protein-S-isoprenylcysteine O-methyltransferase Ste14